MQHTRRPVELDLTTLAEAKNAWARLALPIKIAMLHTAKRNTYAASAEWVQAACAAKGLRPDSPLAGEEWISGPWALLYALERCIRTLRAVDAGKTPCRRVRERGGRAVVDVFPADVYDRILLAGIRAQVWITPGVEPAQVADRAAPAYRQARAAEVCLVLGAGNIASVAPLDLLYKLVAQNAVCMVKMSPVNAYLRPVLERSFEPFVQAGFVRFASGGAETGASLCAHPLVESIHVTGSEATYRAVVREARGKRVTAELGNVSPTIVIPGPWSDAEIRYQAEHIATQKAHNAGFNCIASQVLVLPAAWEHTPRLKREVARVLREIEPRLEYYPGARERRKAIAGTQSRPFTLLDVSPGDAQFFEHEAFCGVLGVLELPGETGEYVAGAVAFANERLHGTLGANLIAHPRTMREHRAEIDSAIAQLRYESIGVNAWTGLAYFLNETPWGSGENIVHNALLLEDTEKSVVYAPFRSFPKPAWFVTNRNGARIGEALCAFEGHRSPANAMRVAREALKG